jgi:hypothetical protein
MSGVTPNGASNHDATLLDVVTRTMRVVEADAAIWVENHRAPMPSDPRAYDRERARRLERLIAANAMLAFHLHLVRRLSLAVPAEQPITEPLFGTVGAVLEWCAYAIPAVEELHGRLRDELQALLAAQGWDTAGGA